MVLRLMSVQLYVYARRACIIHIEEGYVQCLFNFIYTIIWYIEVVSWTEIVILLLDISINVYWWLQENDEERMVQISPSFSLFINKMRFKNVKWNRMLTHWKVHWFLCIFIILNLFQMFLLVLQSSSPFKQDAHKARPCITLTRLALCSTTSRSNEHGRACTQV